MSAVPPVTDAADLTPNHRPRGYTIESDGVWETRWTWYPPRVSLELVISVILAHGGNIQDAEVSNHCIMWRTVPTEETIATRVAEKAAYEERQREGRRKTLDRFAEEFGYDLVRKEEQ